MAEQPPELLEQIGQNANGTTWKARQADGREVIAAQTLLPDEAARQAALDRLRRVARLASSRLTPVRGWWADAQGVWVVSDPEQGVSLPDLPGGGFLSPQQAAAISFGILEGLEALHADGLNHGNLAPESVRVMPDGSVRLTGHQLATLHFPSQEELVAELRAAGRLVCQAFGITPERDNRAAPRAIEHAAPALVVTARSIAGGTMRSDVKAALTALRETSGPLGGSERLSLGAGELAALVATKRSGVPTGQVNYRHPSTPRSGEAARRLREALCRPRPGRWPRPCAPSLAPSGTRCRGGHAAPLAAQVVGGADPPAASVGLCRERPGGPNWLLIGGVLAVLLLAAGGWFGRGLLFGGGGSSPTATAGPPASPSGASSAAPKGSPSAAASGTPGSVPVFAPAAAGAVKGVALKAGSATCSPGSSCALNVVITFSPTGSSHDITWAFKTVDLCTAKVTDFSGGLITADGTWNTTDGNTTISLPAAKGQLAVVALSGPDVAASQPLTLGTAGGC